MAAAGDTDSVTATGPVPEGVGTAVRIRRGHLWNGLSSSAGSTLRTYRRDRQIRLRV